MPAIVHFEIPADDVERARKFYSELFGWDIKEAAPGMEYWLFSTGGEKSVGGGMMKRQNPRQTILDYFDVPSIEQYAAHIEKLGGKVVVPKTAVPGAGYFAVCIDTENNAFGLWKDDVGAK